MRVGQFDPFIRIRVDTQIPFAHRFGVDAGEGERAHLAEDVAQVGELLQAGADHIGIGLDAASRSVFERVKGRRWESAAALVEEAARRYPRRVAVHVIIGLGETEREAVEMIQHWHERDVVVGLFAFTPLRGTPLEASSPPTLAAYRRDLRRYAAFVRSRGVVDPAEIDEALVAAYVGDLQVPGSTAAPRAPASVARALAAVRSFHRFCRSEGLLPTDPSEEVGAPRVPQGIPKALGEPEVERLLGAVTGDGPAAQRDRAILETLYATGVRISELVGLDLDDLDLEAGVLRVLGKGSKERVVPVGRAARQALEEYLVRGRPSFVAGAGRRPGGHPVFLNSRGGRLSRQSCWKVVRDAGLVNASGWIPVDPQTLEVKSANAAGRVYAAGDVTVVPLPGRYKPDMPLALPKAGVFAHAHGEVIAHRIAAQLAGTAPSESFGGVGFCYLETGDGRASMAAGAFYADPPAVTISAPSAATLADKREFERSRLAAWFGA